MSMYPPSPERTSPSGPPSQRGGFGPPAGSVGAGGFGTNALSRDRLGVGSLVFFTVSASAPMTVLAGGVVATFAVSGVIGVPLAFPILAIVLALFAVGYGAMSRHVVNAGVFYAYISKGLGGAWGVAASFVALISYNAIQIGLYGLFGAATGGFIDAKTGLNWYWWAWGFIAMAVVAILGLLKVDLNARLLAVLLVAEVVAVILFDVGALAHPAGGSVSFAGFNPSNLFKAGATGVVFAFSVAAFTGFESAGDYSEEAKNPRRTVAIALAATVAITGVLYTVSAWALGVGYGADKVVSTAQDPNSGMPFGLMASNYNNTIADIANVLLLTSVFAALLSFHNTVGRYLFAAGRERVLPRSSPTRVHVPRRQSSGRSRKRSSRSSSWRSSPPRQGPGHGPVHLVQLHLRGRHPAADVRHLHRLHRLPEQARRRIGVAGNDRPKLSQRSPSA